MMEQFNCPNFCWKSKPCQPRTLHEIYNLTPIFSFRKWRRVEDVILYLILSNKNMKKKRAMMEFGDGKISEKGSDAWPFNLI